MCRNASTILFAITIMAGFRPNISLGQSNDQALPFKWLDDSGETSGVKYQTHRLQPLSLQTEGGPPVQTEQEEVKVDAQTIRITRRAFMTSTNGDRRLTEIVVEEIQKMPGDRVHAVRTISRRDANGGLSTAQQEIQDIVPSGADSCQIKKTLLLPGNNGTLTEKEQVQQTERRTGDKAVEIVRTRYVAGLNGDWRAAERRVSQNTESEGQTRTDEQVYKNDVNNRLALSGRIESTEWKDTAGRHWQSESYTTDLEGKLQLDSHVVMIQKALKDGGQETKEGLRPVRRITEELQVLGPGETERRLEVWEPDQNGGWQNVPNDKPIYVR
jgi:hypothetical protein